MKILHIRGGGIEGEGARWGEREGKVHKSENFRIRTFNMSRDRGSTHATTAPPLISARKNIPFTALILIKNLSLDGRPMPVCYPIKYIVQQV